MRIEGPFDVGRWLALRDDFPLESGATRDDWVEVVVDAMRAEHGADVVDPFAPVIRAAVQHGIDSVDADAVATLQYWPTPLPATAIVTIEGAVAPPEETADLALVPDGVDPEHVRVALIDVEGIGVGSEVRYAVPTDDPEVPELVGIVVAFRGPVGAIRVSSTPVVPVLALALVDDLRGLVAGIRIASDGGEPAWQRATLELAPMRPSPPDLWALEGSA